MTPRGRLETIAVVFDFDDTLVPDSTSLLLSAHGVDTDKFWREDAIALVAEGFDPSPAYMKLILDNVGENRPMGLLSNQSLRDFGATLDDKFQPGIPEVFEDLRRSAAQLPDVAVEFYIISGGLEDAIGGSSIVRRYFDGWYGCRFGENERGVISSIKRCVTFTEKTRYLFEINKGITPSETLEKPFAVNVDVPKESRRIQFENMIYVGDGMTDIPCFSLLKTMGGISFGVFDPSSESSAKRAMQVFLKPQRVVSMHAARFGPRDELGSMLRAAVAAAGSRIDLRRASAQG